MKNGYAGKLRAKAEEDLTVKLTDMLHSAANTLTSEFSVILEGEVLDDACQIVEDDLQTKLLKVPEVVKGMLDEADRQADIEVNLR